MRAPMITTQEMIWSSPYRNRNIYERVIHNLLNNHRQQRHLLSGPPFSL
jgi:hypothetical protein